MPRPVIVDIPSESPALLKTRYPGSPGKRRFESTGIHRARGFVRRTLKGRLPITRPASR